MKDTPNTDPSKSSQLGHKVEFWVGVVDFRVCGPMARCN